MLGGAQGTVWSTCLGSESRALNSAAGVCAMHGRADSQGGPVSWLAGWNTSGRGPGSAGTVDVVPSDSCAGCADPVCCLACHSYFCAQAAQQLQKSGVSQFVLDDMDFGRRYALEKEIRAGGARAWWFRVWG